MNADNALSKNNDNQIYSQIREILLPARAYSAVNFAMVETYWLIGKQIVEAQAGNNRPNIKGCKFQHIAGSLENTKPFDENAKSILESKGVREHVCEVLEGGSEAFEKREQKYGFKK
ncbi:MAG: hypothetical protein LBL04_16470 [Bacteroidales bacterium]|jgi:hypothetical protein|nr:hypothetical protein [Bacteroidales bacterium]